jgi:hypothetical protein
MTYTLKTAASALAVMMIMGGASAAFAKAHDMGVADGVQNPVDNGFANTGAFVQTFPGPGESASNNHGQRGDISSTQKSDGRTLPVVGNGANQR